MALPAFRALGTFASGTTSCTPGLPTGHTTDDILVLIVECDDAETPNTPGGYTSLGSANDGADVKLTVFIKRDGGAESAPTVNGTSNHVHAWIGAYSGVQNTGSPWLLGSFFTNTAAGTITYPGITTEFADALVLLLTAIGDNANDTENLSAYSNANLSTLTDRDDEAETTGTGGGLGFADGGKASAGATGDSSCTHDNAVGAVAVHLALYSATTGPQSITTAFISSGNTRFAPSVTTGAVTVSGAHRGSTLVVSQPSLAYVVAGATIPSGNTRFPPSITVGAVTISGATIPSGSTIFAPSVSQGAQDITGAFISSGNTRFAPSVAPGAVTVVGATIPTGSTLFAPSITVGAVTVVGAHRASTLQLFPPSVAGGAGGALDTTGYHRPTYGYRYN